ncbi:MAG: SpoIID/LytB domain-containing protein [Actinomycetota bacterium]|nr:SpoIID/LytB domain-containing protein [Actinomycetota bacterium]
MRRFLPSTLAAAALALALATSASAAPVFVLKGRGWGHGIGMSQWGAYGLALHGFGYPKILAHYYRGTTISVGHAGTARVLLASRRPALTIGSDEPFWVGSRRLSRGAHRVTPTPRGRIRVEGLETTLASPVAFKPGRAPVELGTRRYRGVLLVRSARSSLSVANRLSLEAYVKGVVANEMPSFWSRPALRAQAVAARSYALATGGHCSFGGIPAFCATVSDQVYGGMETETRRTNAAVDATAGEAVAYRGSVATTFFFSTSGGKTSSKVDEWGGDPIPYLVSVPDPYDSLSPHHRWGPGDGELDCPGTFRDCVYTVRTLRSKLGSALPRGLRDMAVGARNSSSRVEYVTATGTTTTWIAEGELRRLLGLRSSWFSIGVMSLTPSASRVVYGNAVVLRGLARGVGAARLERRPAGGSWSRVSALSPGAAGRWSLSVRPRITTSYRVASASAVGAARRVAVVTRVNFYAPERPYTELRGRVRPARSGIATRLQRKRADGSWATVQTTATNAEGAFSFALTRGGTYRALADAGAGYLLGRTPPLRVVVG